MDPLIDPLLTDGPAFWLLTILIVPIRLRRPCLPSRTHSSCTTSRLGRRAISQLRVPQLSAILSLKRHIGFLRHVDFYLLCDLRTV